jgi:hypothetical protein
MSTLSSDEGRWAVHFVATKLQVPLLSSSLSSQVLQLVPVVKNRIWNILRGFNYQARLAKLNWPEHAIPHVSRPYQASS